MESLVWSDKEFLLRSAHTHNWDLLIENCESIVDAFRGGSRKERLAEANEQLRAMDQWKNTPLHAACFHKPPVEVVHALLRAASSATEPVQLHLRRSRDGSTPLQVACACGASLEVIQAMALTAHNDRLLAGGHAVCTTDRNETTPLADLVTYYELARQAPQHADCPALEDEPHDDNDHSVPFSDFWAKMECLLRAAWQATASVGREVSVVRQSMPSLMHGLANAALASPTNLTRYVCRKCPQEFGLVDRTGNLPLHVAVARWRPPNAKLVYQHRFFVDAALKCFPEAAEVKLRRTHRTPFMQALVSGYDWHCENGESGCVKLLYEANPNAILVRDPVTGHSPLTVIASRACPKHPIREMMALDTVYQILRLNPQALWDDL